MHIQCIRAHAFGPLVDEILELAPGMTVIHGPNESGKSTWHAALYCGLCGMRRARGRGTIEEAGLRDRHRPWGGEAWEVSATVELADGRRIDLHHDLDKKVGKAEDTDLGRDYSNEVIHDGALDGARWLGLDRKSFLNTACVRQADIRSIMEAADGLQDELQRAATTAGADSTAASALQRLEIFRREHVGQDRANSKKPLRDAKERCLQASRAVEGAREGHSAYLRQLEEIERLQSASREAAMSLRLVEAAWAAAEARRWETNTQRARQLVARYPQKPPSNAEGTEAVEIVSVALNQWEIRPGAVDLQGESSEEIRRELERLAQTPEGDTRVHGDVAKARDVYRIAQSALDRHGKERPKEPPVVDFRGLDPRDVHVLSRELALEEPAIDPRIEEQFISAKKRLDEFVISTEERPSGQVRRVPRLLRPIALMIRVILAPIIAAFRLIKGILNQSARIRALEAQQKMQSDFRDAEAQLGSAKFKLEEVRRRRDDARARAMRHELPLEPSELDELAQRGEEADRLRQDMERWKKQNDQLRLEFDEAETSFRDTLAGRGVVERRSVSEGLARYESECSEREQVAQKASRRPYLERAYQDRRRSESLAADSDRLRREASAELRSAATAVGVTGDVDEQIVRSLQAWQRRHQEEVRKLDVAHREWAVLEGLLNGGTLQSLEDESQKYRTQADELAVGLSEQAIRSVKLEPDVEAQLGRQRAALAVARQALAERKGGLDQFVHTMPSVAESEEELERVKAELDRVESLDSTLTRAEETLRTAQEKVFRTVAPVLRDLINPWLSEVTSGRYLDVRIDVESLLVRVTEDGRRWRQAHLLSHGTAEQIYLLLRVAMARLLTRKGETCPLVLDDVTVNCDSRRRNRMLKILHGISRDQQVIVFSQEHESGQWARKSLTGQRDRVVELREIRTN